MMKLLVVGIDQALRDAISPSAERQRLYYEGWSVDIVVLTPGEAGEYELSPGLRVHLTGGKNKAMALYRGWNICRGLCRSQRPSVVSAQDALWSGLLAYLVKGQAGLYLQDHSGLFTSRAKTKVERLFTPISRFLVKRAQSVRTVSKRGWDGLMAAGVDPARAVEIPVATPSAKYMGIPAPDMGARTVLAIGRLEWEKGFDVLLKAWKLVHEAEPEARLRLVGGGSRSASLQDLSRQLGVDASVEFRGPDRDVADEIAWASVVVQPSRFEGWGLAVVEAACAGRPIVMTDVGCAGEVVLQDESGIIIPQEDSGSLAKAILELWREPERARQLGKRAQQIALALPTPAETVRRVRASIEKAAM